MKNTKRKAISFLVLLLLSFGVIGSAHAESTDDTSDKTHLNVWLDALQPENTGEVTIGTSIVKKVDTSPKYNLGNSTTSENRQALELLPSWMSQGSCINGKSGFIFFQSEIVNCETFTVKGAGMNNFSKQFFEDIIEKKKEELLESEKKSDQGVMGETTFSQELKESILEVGEESSSELGKIVDNFDYALNSSEDIMDAFGDLDLGLEDVAEGVSETVDEAIVDYALLEDSMNILGEVTEVTENVSSILGETGSEISQMISESISELDVESISDVEVESTNEVTTIDTNEGSSAIIDGILIGDISTSQKLNTQVDTVLEKFLNPDEYSKPIEVEEESIEVIIEEEEKSEIEEEREVTIDELFPYIGVNSDIDEFTQSLFGPEVNNILYGAIIENDLLSGISANYLAIVLEKFRENKEIIQVGETQIFGIKGYPHYNSELQDVFEKFLAQKPSNEETEKVAKNLSAISFSFSTYTNRTVNSTTKSIFKNKLILDFQQLEKDYKIIAKEATIRNFLLKR